MQIRAIVCRKFLISARSGTTPEEVAFTILHEILVHGLDAKDNIDNKSGGDEHRDFYSDSDFYKKNSDFYSPEYSDILPESEADKYKKIIESTSNSMKNDKKK